MSQVTSQPADSRETRQVVLLGRAKHTAFEGSGLSYRAVTHERDLYAAAEQASRDCIWILTNPHWIAPLVAVTSSIALESQRPGPFGDVVLLEPSDRLELSVPLHSQFRRVVGEVPGYRLLPREQLLDVLGSENRKDLFVGGIVNPQSQTVTLARGDLTSLTVPWSIFPATEGAAPDFNQFELDDYGYALRFGQYEASAHGVLYQVDPLYRRRANRQRIAAEQGFGPSLRRLRLLRGMQRTDFPGISAKTIARLERGETEKPQGKTLERIARALAVAPEEIETY